MSRYPWFSYQLGNDQLFVTRYRVFLSPSKKIQVKLPLPSQLIIH
jgi:hypothetical protein